VAARSLLTPLIVIGGQTGTGKTALAMELAEKYGGEIIAADSRTVYAGMDIGTAKPTAAERKRVPHHGLDVVRPGGRFSAYDFKQLAETAIEDIAGRGKIPFLVGGTGLYIDAILYDFAFRALPDPVIRGKLQEASVHQLQTMVVARGLSLPPNAANPRHLQRILENGMAPQQARQLRPRTLLLGLRLPRDELRRRIEQRVAAMMAGGLIDEVYALRKTYGNVEAFRAPGYQAVAAYLDRVCTLAEAEAVFVRNDLRLAKRQLTWFKRNAAIHWLPAEDKMCEAESRITAFLQGDNAAF